MSSIDVTDEIGRRKRRDSKHKYVVARRLVVLSCLGFWMAVGVLVWRLV